MSCSSGMPGFPGAGIWMDDAQQKASQLWRLVCLPLSFGCYFLQCTLGCFRHCSIQCIYNCDIYIYICFFSVNLSRRVITQFRKETVFRVSWSLEPALGAFAGRLLPAAAGSGRLRGAVPQAAPRQLAGRLRDPLARTAVTAAS